MACVYGTQHCDMSSLLGKQARVAERQATADVMLDLFHSSWRIPCAWHMHHYAFLYETLSCFIKFDIAGLVHAHDQPETICHTRVFNVTSYNAKLGARLLWMWLHVVCVCLWTSYL